MRSFTNSGWSIVPGPAGPEDGPISSIDLTEIAQIDPTLIADRVAGLRGASVAVGESWWDWRATIERAEDWLTLHMTLMGDRDQWWGGFDVAECSSPALLADVTAELAQTLPGLWLHSDDCQMWSPARFLRHWCAESP